MTHIVHLEIGITHIVVEFGRSQPLLLDRMIEFDSARIVGVDVCRIGLVPNLVEVDHSHHFYLLRLNLLRLSLLRHSHKSHRQRNQKH